MGRADEKPVDIDLDDQEPPDRVWSSRQHCLITFESGNLNLEDLNSANGTFVNRVRVYPGPEAAAGRRRRGPGRHRAAEGEGLEHPVPPGPTPVGPGRAAHNERCVSCLIPSRSNRGQGRKHERTDSGRTASRTGSAERNHADGRRRRSRAGRRRASRRGTGPRAAAPPLPPARSWPPTPQPKLVVQRGLKVGIEYPIYEGNNFVGRADEKPVDIDLDDQEPPDRVWSSRAALPDHLRERRAERRRSEQRQRHLRQPHPRLPRPEAAPGGRRRRPGRHRPAEAESLRSPLTVSPRSARPRSAAKRRFRWPVGRKPPAWMARICLPVKIQQRKLSPSFPFA